MALKNMLTFASFATVTIAQHVHMQIPWVESVVSSCTSRFEPFVSYDGPTGVGPFPPSKTSGFPRPPQPTSNCSYWLENIQHQGIAAFNPNTTYQVFRNVKDFGATGDGLTDDTAAINAAISRYFPQLVFDEELLSGGRCAPGSCASSTIYPAVVYFPTGNYLISSSIIDFYYTQIIGNPNCLPTITATFNFSGLGLIDGDLYGANGLSYGATNVFWRQIRNFNLDMTNIPANASATGIHWPTAQATSLQNIFFYMSSANGTQHQGVFIESGSGGFMTDLTFYGGLYGGNFGNQQFTMRNMTFYNAVTAINQLYDWGWTYYGLSINNCSIGLNISSGGLTDQSVGSITFFDSVINNTPVGIITAYNGTSVSNSIILENLALNNVPVAVQDINGTVSLAGSTGVLTIPAWGEGHAYLPNGPVTFQGYIAPNQRPASLLRGSNFYVRSKPQYGSVPVTQFLSARNFGATGNGVNDDTQALQNAINATVAAGKILFVDAGTYKVTSTIYLPSGSYLVGESYSVIMGSGAFFSDMNNPQPVVQVGKPGEKGYFEWSDMIVSTQGNAMGAVLFEINMESGPVQASSSQCKRANAGWSSSPTAQSGFSTVSIVGSASALGKPSSGIGSSSGSGPSPSHSLYTGSYGGYPGPSQTGSLAPYTTGWPGPAGPLPSPPCGNNQGPSGIWDVHARVGGFAGSNLQVAQCPTTPNITVTTANLDQNCIAAYMTMHITKSATNLYLENVWLWTADHDVENVNLTQITVYNGRGLYDESAAGIIWLVGTAVEHHTLYQYHFANTQNVFQGQIQTETAYYQPNPPAYIPFPVNPVINDPDFRIICAGYNATYNTTINPPNVTVTGNCDGYGLRILNSPAILTYGAGLYSFFNNYNTTCSAAGNGEMCQPRIFEIDGTVGGNLDVYNLNTIGAMSMINENGLSLASYADNIDVFPDTIALFRD